MQMAFCGGNPNGSHLAGEGYMELAQRNSFTEEACDSVTRKMNVRVEPYGVDGATLTLYNA